MVISTPENIVNPPFPELLTSSFKQTGWFQVYSLQFWYLHLHSTAPYSMGIFPDFRQLFPEQTVCDCALPSAPWISVDNKAQPCTSLRHPWSKALAVPWSSAREVSLGVWFTGSSGSGGQDRAGSATGRWWWDRCSCSLGPHGSQTPCLVCELCVGTNKGDQTGSVSKLSLLLSCNEPHRQKAKVRFQIIISSEKYQPNAEMLFSNGFCSFPFCQYKIWCIIV